MKITSFVLIALASACVWCCPPALWSQPANVAPDPAPAIGSPGNRSASTNALAFNLKPTTIAPANAAGSASLKGRELSLHLTHLGPGRYRLEAINRSGGLRQRLGEITIVDPTLAPDRLATDNKKEASAGPEEVRVDTDAKVTLPVELVPSTIARIMVSDAGGNALLAGDAQ